jgi:hypothetical protein
MLNPSLDAIQQHNIKKKKKFKHHYNKFFPSLKPKKKISFSSVFFFVPLSNSTKYEHDCEIVPYNTGSIFFPMGGCCMVVAQIFILDGQASQ